MKYIKKSRKEDEKKVMSTRVRSIVFDAFQNASEAAKEHGYSISLSDVVETALKETIAEFAEVSGIDYLAEEHNKLQQIWDDEFEQEMLEYEQKQQKGRIIYEINERMKLFKDSQFSEEKMSQLRLGVESYMRVLYGDKYLGGPDAQVQYVIAKQKDGKISDYKSWIRNYITELSNYVDANIENDLDKNALLAKKLIDQLSIKTSSMGNKSSNNKETS